MMCTHVHLRDGKEQKHKETILHGLYVAYKTGLDGAFEMPNTDPALTTTEAAEERMEMGDKAIENLEKKGMKIFHGIFLGVTDDPKQIEEVVGLHDKYFPRIVGLKMFAGHSTGNMGLITEKEQRIVYQTLAKLDYRGVLTVHCENEDFINSSLWNYKEPISHTRARPLQAETTSLSSQLRNAEEAGYKGIFHMAHISAPRSLMIIERQREYVSFKLTCEVTPHHCVLYDELMNKPNGIQLKMNPALRPKDMQEFMLDSLIEGRINCIGTDHAPHTLAEKQGEKAASGIPGLPYYPRFINLLREKGMSEERIDKVTHDNAVEIFNLPADLILNTRRAGKQTEEEIEELEKKYEFNAFSFIN